jgi:Transposase DDE domain
MMCVLVGSEFEKMKGFKAARRATLDKALHLSVEKPHLSFSATFGNVLRQPMAEFFADKRTNPEVVHSGHLPQTLARVESSHSQYIVVAQDTTLLNTGTRIIEGNGTLQGSIKGFLIHSAMAFDTNGLPLGIINQQYWTRKGALNLNRVESTKWAYALEKTQNFFGKTDKTAVLVADREADVFDFLKYPKTPNVEILIRMHEPRNLQVCQSGIKCKLPEIEPHLSTFANRKVVISRQNKEVEIELQLCAGSVEVYAPGQASARHKSRPYSLVIAREISCVDAKTRQPCVVEPQDKCCWYLLCTLPIQNQQDVERIVDFYALRWGIERFHFTLKSGGFEVEKMQFDDIESLVNAVSFYSIAAWQIMYLTYFARHQAQDDAQICFDEQEIEALKGLSKKHKFTIKEAVLLIAKLVGFTPSRKQPLPGIKVMGRALQAFHFIKIGFNAKTNTQNSPPLPLQD